jgi:hypothetical protein
MSNYRNFPDYFDPQPQFATDYEPGFGWHHFLEFKESVEDVLARSLQERQELSLHETTPYPWLDIVLIFISTTSATAILNKLNEDIYEHFKGKFLKRRSKGDSRRKEEEPLPMEFSIEVTVKKILRVRGEVECSDYEDAINALSSLSQMFADAKSIKAREFEQVDGYTREFVEQEEFEVTEGKGFTIKTPKFPPISYVYDKNSRRWTLKA